MSTRTLQLSPELHAYLVQETLRESPLVRRLREETARLERGRMQISPEQGQFMRLLVSMLGARRAIEIGTFTGLSALCVAEALPAEGRLICCDTSHEWTAIARRYWAEAGVADRIELRLAPGVHTLDALIAGRQAGSFDFAFVDADKEGYDNYYERLLVLLRPGGVVAFDNALRHGQVANADDRDPETIAIRTLNRKIRDDPRVFPSLVPIGDGLLLARKS